MILFVQDIKTSQNQIFVDLDGMFAMRNDDRGQAARGIDGDSFAYFLKNLKKLKRKCRESNKLKTCCNKLQKKVKVRIWLVMLYQVLCL